MPYASKELQREYSRRHYREHKQAYIARNKRRYREWRAHVDSIKAAGKCLKCSATTHLEFHHRNPKTKKFNISDVQNATSLADLKNEIAKCDLLCTVCHDAVGGG